MTDEELDLARAKEAYRRWNGSFSGPGGVVEIAARLAREGWVPADPLVLEAREIFAAVFEPATPGSVWFPVDGTKDRELSMTLAVTALKRGIEIGRAEYMRPSIDTALQEPSQ